MADPTITGLDDSEAFEEGRYDPSTVEANRSRQQGLGVGARDLQAQKEPQVYVAEEDDLADDEEG